MMIRKHTSYNVHADVEETIAWEGFEQVEEMWLESGKQWWTTPPKAFGVMVLESNVEFYAIDDLAEFNKYVESQVINSHPVIHVQVFAPAVVCSQL